MVPRTFKREFSWDHSSGDVSLTPVAASTDPRPVCSTPRKPSRLTSWSLALMAGVALSCASVWVAGDALARRPIQQETTASESSVPLSSLPVQAQEVHRRIIAGGPFRFAKDGTVFGNRERLLPRQPRGFYREYTVPTPGERDRGARRIVCGGKDERQPETCFYTKDHYQSFQPIDPRH